MMNSERRTPPVSPRGRWKRTVQCSRQNDAPVLVPLYARTRHHLL